MWALPAFGGVCLVLCRKLGYFSLYPETTEEVSQTMAKIRTRRRTQHRSGTGYFGRLISNMLPSIIAAAFTFLAAWPVVGIWFRLGVPWHSTQRF